MSLARLRTGEWVGLVGAVGLFVLLFFDWFGVTGATSATHLHLAGWTSLGWLMDVLLCIAIFGGLALAYMTVARTSPAWPVGASVLTSSLGGIIFLILLVRVLTQPGLGADLPNAAVTIQWPAYAGLVCAALIPAGAWRALADERLDAPEPAYTPPPARPVPGT